MPFLGPSLIKRFESKVGYKAFDDVEPCRKLYRLPRFVLFDLIISSCLPMTSMFASWLVPAQSVIRLKKLGVKAGVVSNADSRISQFAFRLAGLLRILDLNN